MGENRGGRIARLPKRGIRMNSTSAIRTVVISQI